MSDSPPSSENRFWPTNLVCRKVSNASALLSRRRMLSCSSRLGFWCGRSTRSWIQARSSGSWMCMYSMPIVRHVGVPQHAEDVAQLHQRLAAEAAGGELALQVPQRQAVRLDVEVGVLALAVVERVGVGHEVAAHPVGVDQLEHPGRLGHVVVVADRDVVDPAHRLVRDAQRLEDLVVERVLAEQQLVDLAEELAGLRALDDPVVVGRGEREDLAHREAGEGLVRRRPGTRPGTPSRRRR